ncbi:hypothetical protein ACFV4N_28045 [Actinosynnema sp. NPDC059797]
MIHVRQFAWPDYDDVTEVWKAAGRDALPRAELEAKLERDPQLFLVARHGDAVAGVVLGTFDGRRGRSSGGRWVTRRSRTCCARSRLVLRAERARLTHRTPPHID